MNKLRIAYSTALSSSLSSLGFAIPSKRNWDASIVLPAGDDINSRIIGEYLHTQIGMPLSYRMGAQLLLTERISS
jgi:acyl transferase domain-containing protein